MSKRSSPDGIKRATNKHPIHELLAARYSPYGFDPGYQVSASELCSLFEAVRWAASSFNEQPWRFLSARREETEAFERLLSCLIEFNQSWACHASALFIGMTLPKFSSRDERNPAAVHDLGIATATLTLEASARGLAAHAMIGIEAERVRSLCAVPAEVDPVIAIALGKPGHPPGLAEKLAGRDREARERKALGDFVFGAAWQRPATFLEP